ncbi:hypothetical protein H6F44_14530 [Pseudanabaena sp. FACHB-1277]|jgi:transposase-like protein|uniref:Transposase n=1 Tax=Pseudanabaena cinerea FACHB-1277 TaxID=2949581 RepID=A0A926UUY8_9CYAN|nr:hypothetical protein [Pseudanabaena cinerea FACHB-1277]
MSVRDIQSQLEEMYGVEVSPTLIANVTNAVLIACVDGLTVFPNAIQTVFPKNTVQLCIVHMVQLGCFCLLAAAQAGLRRYQGNLPRCH